MQGQTLTCLDYAVVGVFFAVMVGVGVFFSRRAKSTDQFFGGDKSIPWWLSGISFYMCSFSALAFVMYSALAYKYGWVPVTVSWLSVPAVLLGARFLAVRWRRAAKSSPIEFITQRYSARMCQALAYLGLPMQILDLSFKLLAIGTVVGLMVKSLFPADFPIDTVLGWAIALSGIVIICYTFLGGLKATLVCDFIQFFVILVPVLVLPVLCLGKLAALAPAAADAGGLETMRQGFAVFLERAPAGFFKLTADRYDGWYMLVFFLIVGSNLSTTWSLVQRYYSTKSDKDAKKVGYLVATLLFVGPPLFFFPAMAARIFIPDLDMNSPDAMNGVYALVCLTVLPAGMIGMVVAAMFSATMSTLAGGYNAIASVLTNEIYARLRPGASARAKMRVARLATVVVGLMVIVLTFVMRAAQGKSDLFDVTNKMFAVFLPPIAITMLVGILVRHFSKRAGICALVSGIAAGLAVFVFAGFVPEVALCGVTFGLRNMGPMFTVTTATTFLALFAGTRLFPDTPAERAEIDAFFRQVEAPAAP